MPVPSNPGQPGSPAEAQYGQAQEIDAQMSAAPMGVAQTPGVPTGQDTLPQSSANQGPAALPPDVFQQGGNVVQTLPPSSYAPSEIGAQPLSSRQQVAYAVMNLAGVSGLAKSFASQLVGTNKMRFTPMEAVSQEVGMDEEVV